MEKQKLIYVESKAKFSPSEVSDKAIVFIKDTKEIWTHGVYFSCSGTWATPITLSLTGDTTGSVSIDGSGNASIATTTKYLSGTEGITDANSAANTQWHKIAYYTKVARGTPNLFPAKYNANAILSLNVHDYSYIHQLGFSSDGNIYHRRRDGDTWETTWKTILNSSNYSSYALPLSGGTMTGALNFANNTWNKVGNNAYMGDFNVAGMIGIKGSNAATPGFAMYNNSGTLLGKLYASGTSLYWSNAKILTSTDSIGEADLAWGGKNLADNSSPIDAALTPRLGANRLAFLSPDAINIEYSQDGGTTWVDYGVTDAQKVQLFAGGNNYTVLYLGGDSTQDASIDRTSWRLRITISAIGYSLYCKFLKFMIYVNREGNTLGCALQGRTYSNVQNDVDTWVTFQDTSLAGWSGWNTINHPAGITIPHTDHYGQIRFEFYMTSQGSTGKAPCILKIMGFASACWTWPSNMAGYGDIYSYDWQQNVAFPAKVTATGGFSGNLTGNADTTSFLKCPNKRYSYPAQIVTSGGNIGAAFMTASKLGLSDGSFYDAVILRGYGDSSGGSENALLFSKNTSSVYHSQYAFGSTTTWGTMYKFLDSGNYTNYTINYAKSTLTSAESVGVINDGKLYYNSQLSFATFAPDDNDGNVSYELIAELPNYGTGTNTHYINYGISGFMWSHRVGYCCNTNAYPITAIVSIGPETFSKIKVPVTTDVLIPFIVKYNDKYYIALRKTCASTNFYFMGQKLNLLTTTIKVNDASLIEEIAGPITETSTASKFYNNGTPQEYLHAGNYNNYALPLYGGTLGSTSAIQTELNIQSSTSKLRLLAYSGTTNYIQSGNAGFTDNANLTITGIYGDTGSNLHFNFANIYCRAGRYTNIDSGNYSSYALSLSGGTLTGTLISRDVRPSANLSYSLGTSSYYYNYVYANYFKKSGSSDSYVLLGGGGHKAVSDFAPNNVATLSSSGTGNSDQWTLVFEKSYPNYWYAPTTMFYIRSVSAGCGILCFYNYWNSGTQLNDYEREVWFFGAGKSETGTTFGGANRDINDYLRIYIDKANFKYCIYYNRYNDQSLQIQELQFFTVPESGEYFSTGTLRSSFFTNSTTVVNLPTESSTLVRVPIKTTYNHDRTIRTTKSVYASSFYENSDIRLKENIRGIDQSDLTKQVDLVQFNFKDSGTKKYGVIAQQLEQVGLQNLVYENDGKKAVDYISLLVLEIQRLRNEIGELKQEINKKS